MAQNVLIVEARFYTELADALVEGAVAALETAEVDHERIAVPGVLEIPPAIAMGVDAGRFDAFVCLGCVIRGETSHYDIVANESARAIMDLAVRHRLALGNGILTVEDTDQAWARASLTKKDKGGDAARAALAMIDVRTGLGADS